MAVRDPRFSTQEHIQALSLRNLQNFQKAMGVLKEPRVVQGIQETRKMFTGIKGAASSIIGLGSRFDFLGSVMKGVQPLLDMISSLFSALSAGISSALIPVFQQFAALLPTLIPIFVQIGEFIGRTIAIALVPLLELIEMFLPIIEPILPVLFQLLELGLIPLQVIFEVIFAVLEPLLPFFQDLSEMFSELSPVIEGLTPIITQLIKWSFVPLVSAIYGVGLVIAGIIDFFSLGTAKAVKGWKNFMEPILESLLGIGGGGGEGVSETAAAAGSGHSYEEETPHSIRGFQYGGYVMAPMIARVGEVPEQIKPLSRIEEEQAIQTAILGELMQINSVNKQLLEEKKWNNVWKRIE